MQKYSWLLFSLILFIACAQESQTDQTATTEAPGSPPAAVEEELKPPYVITDSSNVVTTPEGIHIYYIKKGTGAIPKPGSNVVINYHGTLLDGTYFDGSFDKDGVADFSLARLIQGWQIALTQTPTGSKVKLIIPGEYGYGAAGSPPNIPPNATLIFDIELLGTY